MMDLTQPIDLKKLVTPASTYPNYEDPNSAQTPVAPMGQPAPNPIAPAVTPGVAPSAPASVANAVAPAYDPNSYLGGVFNQAPAAPAYNQQSEETLRSLAKATKVGEFFQLLGDTYGVSKGAPVAQRQMTSSAPYLQKILENRQKHEQDMAAFREREFARKMQLATGAARQAQLDRQFQESQNRYNTAQLNAAEKDEATKKYRADQKAAQEAAAKLASERFDETKAQNKTSNKLAQERVDKTAVPKDKQDKVIKTEKQTYTLAPEDYSLLRGQAIGNAQVQANHPEWFTTTQGKRGKIITKLNPDVKDDDLVRALKEIQETAGVAPANQGYVNPTTGLPPYIAPTNPADRIPASDAVLEDNKYNFAKPATSKPASAAAGIY